MQVSHTLLYVQGRLLCNCTGSVIYSDEWRAYSGIPAITGKNYTHHTVNHSQNFVDPVTGMLTITIVSRTWSVFIIIFPGSHTQGVESMWSQCKLMMRKTQTIHSHSRAIPSCMIYHQHSCSYFLPNHCIN